MRSARSSISLTTAGIFCPAESGGGAQAALAGDELVALPVRGAANRHGLQESVALERRLELGQLLGAELLSWLEGIRADLVNGELAEQIPGLGRPCQRQSAAAGAWVEWRGGRRALVRGVEAYRWTWVGAEGGGGVAEGRRDHGVAGCSELSACGSFGKRAARVPERDPARSRMRVVSGSCEISMCARSMRRI